MSEATLAGWAATVSLTREETAIVSAAPGRALIRFVDIWGAPSATLDWAQLDALKLRMAMFASTIVSFPGPVGVRVETERRAAMLAEPEAAVAFAHGAKPVAGFVHVHLHGFADRI